ncbi:MAG TPA: fumarate hydratase C-terminal domain-containing protein, partial [Anaerovoracaceae bacterium]|nr:fumarate hydratase C-terminal domain-containing protein [Anaerovoracaceae bacterium]
GIIYTGRDATHRRMFEDLDADGGGVGKLPFELVGQVIYYMGPTPPRPGRVIGAAGPTTSIRMDSYTPRLLDLGLSGMIGKGYRTQPVIESIQKNRAVYFVAIGGAGALASIAIKESVVYAYPELGPEAVYKLEVVDFPVIVANDCVGGDVFVEEVGKYRKYKK